MNKQKLLILLTVLILIGSLAAVLARCSASQKLGRPGIRTRPLPGTANLELLLPEHVLAYDSDVIPESQIVADTLPKDTSFGQRLYKSADGSWVQMYAVLMGADRTSLHKPQICMPGQGFTIDKTEVIPVPMTQPHPYDLPVIKLTISKPAPTAPGGVVHAMFIYWYVADGRLSADVSALRRMWLSSKNLFLTGELQRWAYVACFTVYPPGGEDACVTRMKRFLADAVPQFQLATGPDTARPTPAANP